MRKLLILLLVLSSCLKEESLYKGEAEAISTEIFGFKAQCEGERSPGGTRSGWVCMHFEFDASNRYVLVTQPIVVCRGTECHKLGPKQTTMGPR